MSRPKKIIPPIKVSFNEILERIADGHGVKKRKSKRNIVKASKDGMK